MKRFIYYILATMVVVTIHSCSRFNPFAEKGVLARVGETVLYQSDVELLFTPGMTPQDSIKLLESYVDMWVRKQLKIQEAEKLFGKSSTNIEQLVEEYRNSLLSHKLDQFYVESRLDTLYTDSAVMTYYNTYRSDFALDRPIVKGRVVKMPENARQLRKLKELIGGDGDKLLDFRDLSSKNEYELTEFVNWTDYNDFLAALPVSRNTDYDDLLTKQDVIEINDGGYIYLAYITERKLVGEANPIERVSGVIRRVLVNQRKQEIIREYEDSLYRYALEKRTVDLKVK